ncbi:unnamed protein product [Brachionus calyciflorus]|uniref:Uncharacterized protein n=1 Tax=Brachionus calyciflorus TaxID=104777 RepID=A0A814G8J6_9BILA|nr:unnamed protein product [Brachionus calyciflorus]
MLQDENPKNKEIDDSAPKTWVQIKIMHHMKVKALAFRLDKLVKIYKDTFEVSKAIMSSPGNVEQRKIQADELDAQLNKKYDELNSMKTDPAK